MPFLGASSGSFFAGRRRSLPSSVDVFFSKGEDYSIALGAGDYDPEPKGGIVYGDTPEPIFSATPGSSIIVPDRGTLTRGERWWYFPNRVRAIPDHYIPLSFRGWSDGAKEYYPGDEYVVPFYNVTFTATWDVGRSPGPGLTVRNTLNEVLGTQTEQASFGDKIYFHTDPNAHMSLKIVTGVEFLGRIDGTTGGTTPAVYSANFNIIDHDVIEVTVPDIPPTSNRFTSAVNRYATFVNIIRPNLTVTFPDGSTDSSGTSIGPSSGATVSHRWITIV